MEEPGRLQSMGLLKVRHDWATSLSLFTFMHWRRTCNPLRYSCLENPRDGGAWWAAVYGVAQSWTRLKRLSSSSSRSHLWLLGSSLQHTGFSLVVVAVVLGLSNCGVACEIFAIVFLWDLNENGPFQSCGYCWVFQICWHIECSTFTASSFRIWNRTIGIPSLPQTLFVVMLP